MTRDRPELDPVLTEIARDPSGFAPLVRAPNAFLVFDPNGRVVEANPQACRDLGYSREELLRQSIWDLSTRQTPEEFEKLLRALYDGGAQTLFGHNRRKDGSTYSVEAHLWIAPFGDQDCVWAVLLDARQVQGLIEERDQLISLIENSSNAISVVALDERFSYMNSAGLALVGVETVDELSALSFLDLHPEFEHRDLRERILPQVKTGRWQGELYYRNRRTGGLVPCWMNAFAIRHSQTGEIIGLAAVAHDISAMKEAERQRERLLKLNEVSRNVATSLLENDDLNQAISIIFQGVGGILSVSRAYLCRYREDRRWVYRTHQWSAGDGACDHVARQPEASDQYDWATRILVGGEVIRIDDVAESSLIPRTGSPLFLPDVRAVLIIPVIIHGRMESFFCFVDTHGRRVWSDDELAILQIIVDSFARAIERRIADREREEIAQDLERAVAREMSANRYKSEFLANMSHELRTPMNAIVGYAELLSRPNVDRHKQDTWIKNIRRSTNYLLNLVNDVLDLSKIEAGQMTIEKESCDLVDAVSEVLNLLRVPAEEKLVRLEAEYDGPIPETIETDPIRFKQILINLVGNAIKFTPKGSVTVRLGMEDRESGGKVLRVRVVDTGIGIAPEAVTELFQPFAQVHARRDPRFGGTGLGLQISRHLARLLGGEIEVQSQVDVGSTFTLVLPLRAIDVGRVTSPPRPRAEAGPAPSPAAPSSLLEGSRILIVDDSPENVEVLRFLLSEAGSSCEAAENGALGVKAAMSAQSQGHPFDAILMDMNMPVLDGFEATRQLIQRGVSSPIIALTAFAMADDKERCRQAGCVDYVTKPVVPHSFFATLTRHVKVRRVDARPPDEEAFSLAKNPRFAPLIARYVASFPELIERLKADFRDGRSDDVRTQVHRLRGTASNYGFPDISHTAGRCEDAIRSGQAREVVERELDELLLHLARAVPG